MRLLNLQKSNRKSICYKIADSLYCSDTNIDGLEYLIQAHRRIDTSKLPQLKPSSAQEIYNKDTEIGENNYPINVKIDAEDNYHVNVNSDNYVVEKERISADISHIDMTILMGPVFILHLAKNKIFCLHASAFLLNNTCFILMADSGTGKSTIARHIDKQELGLRLADDIVVLKCIKDSINLMVNFPQLKLSQDQQYKGKDVCKKTILLFAQKSEKETSFSKVDDFNGMKKLIKHSVASKLFALEELNNHLKFCHKTSEQCPSYQLNYQHSKNSLSQLVKVLNDID